MVLPIVTICQEILLVQVSTPHHGGWFIWMGDGLYTISTSCFGYIERKVLRLVENLAFPTDLIRLMEAKLEKKLFVQDSVVVLAHYMTVIKDLINPLIAISSTMLNRFFC